MNITSIKRDRGGLKMRYKEFENYIEDWEKKYDYNNLDWRSYRNLSENTKGHLFENATEFAATKPEDREDEKRFIIPLPGLVTTDGKQQYLTHKDCKFFASRSNPQLRQTWKEEHLKFIPEIYRQFAVIGGLEKKYYLRLPIFGYDDEQNYLNLERDTGKYLFGSKENIEGYQTQFTQKEIEELQRKYNLDSFVIVEVEK